MTTLRLLPVSLAERVARALGYDDLAGRLYAYGVTRPHRRPAMRWADRPRRERAGHDRLAFNETCPDCGHFGAQHPIRLAQPDGLAATLLSIPVDRCQVPGCHCWRKR